MALRDRFDAAAKQRSANEDQNDKDNVVVGDKDGEDNDQQDGGDVSQSEEEADFERTWTRPAVGSEKKRQQSDCQGIIDEDTDCLLLDADLIAKMDQDLKQAAELENDGILMPVPKLVEDLEAETSRSLTNLLATVQAPQDAFEDEKKPSTDLAQDIGLQDEHEVFRDRMLFFRTVMLRTSVAPLIAAIAKVDECRGRSIATPNLNIAGWTRPGGHLSSDLLEIADQFALYLGASYSGVRMGKVCHIPTCVDSADNNF